MVKRAKLLEHQIHDIHEQHIKNTQVSTSARDFISSFFLLAMSDYLMFPLLLYVNTTVMNIDVNFQEWFLHRCNFGISRQSLGYIMH